MAAEANSVKTIFLAAIEKDSAARAAFLDAACGGDAALRCRVEALLAAHGAPGDFLERPAKAVADAAADPPAEHTETNGLSPFAVPPVAGATPDAGPDKTQAVSEGEDHLLDFLAPPAKPGHLGRLGHYEVLAVVGRGGMGVVLRAFDEKLHRVVAIKAMAPQLATNGMARKRFVREAQAAAAITHENVIDIHAVDDDGPVPYLVMRYVDGLSLEERIKRSGALELKEVLRIGLQTAEGLAAAHKQGLVHRDVKPGNILLENGVQRVKLTDFGLARAVDDASLTQSGCITGTPMFMAPEQARGEPVDFRSDLFSLGSVLYTLCTGHAPFRAANSMAVLKRVCEETPRPVHEVNPDMPVWMTAIVAKLHAKDPAKRYQSAAEVAGLLGQHLANLQQPAPMAPSPAPRRRRWSWTAALLLVALAPLGYYFAPKGIRLVTDKDESAAAMPTPGPENKTTTPRAELAPALPLGPPLDSLDAAQIPAGDRFTWQPNELVAIFGGHAQRHLRNVNGVDYSANGQWIATAADEGVYLWDAVTMRRLALLGDGGGYYSSVAFSPDNKTLASSYVVTGAHRVRFWDLSHPEFGEQASLNAHNDCIHRVIYSRDGKTLAAASNARDHPAEGALCRLWDLSGAAPKEKFSIKEVFGLLAFAPDGKTLVAACANQVARLWDVTGAEPKERFAFKANGSGSASFSTDGRLLAFGTFDGIGLWDLTPEPKFKSYLPGRFAAFAPDGKSLATCGGDDAVRLWDVAGAQAKDRFPVPGRSGPVRSLAFAAGDRMLVAGGRNGVTFWDCTKTPLAGQVVFQANEPVAAALAPDGKSLAVQDGAGLVTLFDLDGTKLRERQQFRGSMAFAPVGNTLALAAGPTIRLLDLSGKHPRERSVLQVNGEKADSLTFSADGRTLACRSADMVRLWDLSGEEPRQRDLPIKAADGNHHPLALAPDGKSLVAVLPDFRLSFWDLAAAKPSEWQLSEGHQWLGPIAFISVAFAPDGETLASIDDLGNVILWDARSAKKLHMVKLKASITSLAFAADSRHLAVGLGSGQIYLLRLTPRTAQH